MQINFHGVRGSYPVPGDKTIRYGGNTTCISITTEYLGMIIRVIVDMGNGAITAGKVVLANYFAKKEGLKQAVLFTHLHPDHTQGFPFYAPNFIPGSELHLMGMKTLKKHIGNVLEQEMLPPTFPIEYKDLKSKRIHYEVKDGQVFYINGYGVPVINIGDGDRNNTLSDPVFKIQAMQSYAPSHPQQGAMYYKITEVLSGKTVACTWDLESHYGGDKRVIAFARGSDVIIHDTQYTDDEYNSEKMIVQGFGHSTYNMAVENAKQSGAKQLICMHYNPIHTDDFLDDFSKKFCLENKDINIIFSKEGMVLNV